MGLLDRFRDERQQAKPTKDTRMRSAPGRGHTEGFLDLEEFNDELRHPHGHAVYDRMFRTDGDVRQAVMLVVNPAVSGTWAVVPHGGEQADKRDVEIAEKVKWALWDVMQPNLPQHLMTALPVLVRSGFAPFETAWMIVEDEGKQMVVPRTLGLRLPRTVTRFEQDEFGQLRAIWQQLPVPAATLVRGPARRGGAIEHAGMGGVAPSIFGVQSPTEVRLEARNLIYYRIGAEGDNWEGVSLLRPAYKHWLLKDKIERIDAIAQEREAVGIPIAYPPMGATGDQLTELEEVLKAIRANSQGYIVAPGPKAGEGAPEGQGWLFEVIGYDRTGSGRDPHPSLEYHTQKIAASFISEFMRLGHGQSGARATAQVQQDPFLQSVEAIVSIVEQTINEQLVYPMVAYNWPDVDNPPRLQMSLVDSTSLSQLADYVLKLTQVGALLPDQELENFLRARADLPAPNPESVKKRKDDDEVRRMIVSGAGSPGGGANNGFPKSGDRYGQNSKPGLPHGSKSAPARSQSGGGAGSLHSDDAGGDVLLEGDLARSRPWRDEPRWFELATDWEALDDAMCDAPRQVQRAAGDLIMETARQLADASTPLGSLTRDSDLEARLHTAIRSTLAEMYLFGAQSAQDDLVALRVAMGYPDEDGADVTLDRGAIDRGAAALDARAQLAAERVLLDMRRAMLSADLMRGDDGAYRQLSAETAGEAALRRIGLDHGTSAIQQGRHDRILALADEGEPIVGVRYSSRLDANTCRPCADADDGKLRALNDPVRLANRPPNPHCHSTASGENLCRCVEVFEVSPPEGFEMSVESVDDQPVPPFIAQTAQFLISRGMKPRRALVAAVNIARAYCSTGRLLWPGLRRWGPGTQGEACEAYTAWKQRAG